MCNVIATPRGWCNVWHLFCFLSLSPQYCVVRRREDWVHQTSVLVRACTGNKVTTSNLEVLEEDSSVMLHCNNSWATNRTYEFVVYYQSYVAAGPQHKVDTSVILYLDRIWSFVWKEYWEGLLVGTDVSTSWAEVIVRVENDVLSGRVSMPSSTCLHILQKIQHSSLSWT